MESDGRRKPSSRESHGSTSAHRSPLVACPRLGWVHHDNAVAKAGRVGRLRCLRHSSSRSTTYANGAAPRHRLSVLPSAWRRWVTIEAVGQAASRWIRGVGMTDPAGGRGNNLKAWVAGAAVLVCAVLGLLVVSQADYRGSSPISPITVGPSTATITAELSPVGPPSPFAMIDAQTRGLVRAAATWHSPPSLDVDKTARIGLELGNRDAVKSQIAALLPGTSPTSGGTVEVGPTVRAKLLVDPADAEVVPSEAIDASTGTDIAMLWTWFVHPKRPTSGLLITAHLEVPLSEGHVVSIDLPLTVRVNRTATFTLGQIFTNWTTWAAIVGVGAPAVGWWWRRRAAKSRSGSGPRRQSDRKSWRGWWSYRSATVREKSGSAEPPGNTSSGQAKKRVGSQRHKRRRPR